MAQADGDDVETEVVYLEMTAPPSPVATAPAVTGIEIHHARRPTTSFYRYLYDTVGAPWLWTERRLLDDRLLRAILDDPAVEVNVLWVEGVPAGYAEIDRRQWPEVELAYFGLAPSFIGRGLGGHLLSFAIGQVWRQQPSRFWVHSCDLDHPAALGVYQNAGFRIYARGRDRVRRLPGMALPDHWQARELEA